MKLSQIISEFHDWRGFKVSGHTVVRYDMVLRIFCLCMGDPHIEQIELRHILGYMHEMERLGWKANGLSIVALALRKLFEFSNLRGFKCLDEALIPLPRKEFRLPRVATDKDYKRMLGAVSHDYHPTNIRNRALLMMVWDTWARTGEIISLDLSDLKFNKDKSGSATIKTEKSRGKRPIREIFWTPETGKALSRWINKREQLKNCFEINSDALFVSINKCGLYDNRGKRMTNRGVTETFRIISNRAGIGMVNPHSMRHHGGREIIKCGGSNADVSNLLGHSHLESSAIYTMMYGKDLETRWRKFHKFKKGKTYQQHIFHGSLKR